MMAMPLWDPGLQSERTRLAWVRTAVMLAVGGLAAGGAALRAGVTGLPVAALGLAALCGAVLLVRTGARYRHVQRALHEGRPLDARPDALIAWLGTLAVICASLAVIAHLA
jgi:uncharacterized membrane protein YidH (DUF202 family)